MIKMKFKAIFLSLVVFAIISAPVIADEGVSRAVMVNESPYQNYVISAVLQKTGNEGVIRLVHKVQKGRNEDEAAGAFFKEVLQEFKGYSVVDSLIGVVPPEKASCETWL